MSSFLARVHAKFSIDPTKKLEVAVGVGKNVDMAYDPVNHPVVPTKKVKVSSISEAISVCKKFIAEHDIGGGSWAAGGGGWIFEDGKKIARISYNGNVFDLNDRPLL